MKSSNWKLFLVVSGAASYILFLLIYQDENLIGFCAFKNPTFSDGIPDIMKKFNTFQCGI